MSKLICPQCRLHSSVDCQETDCPGETGFIPSAWQRPLFQITQDLERYESLIVSVAWDLSHNIKPKRFVELVSTATSILEKQKKEGRTDG